MGKLARTHVCLEKPHTSQLEGGFLWNWITKPYQRVMQAHTKTI